MGDACDVAVVGGGPAGLAVAIGASAAGASVVVLDHQRPPIDKACGEGLMPRGAAALGGLGIPAEALGRPFRGIRYVDAERPGAPPAEGLFLEGCGVGIRRPRLHEAMVARASAAGADLRWGVRVTGMRPDGIDTTAGPLRAGTIVGADGLHSRVRRWAGLAGGPARRRRFGVRRHFALAPWTDSVEVHWTGGAEAYVTPVSGSEVGIALLADAGEESRFAEQLARFPELAERLRGAEPTSARRGAGPFHQRTRGVVTGRVALIGDASGYLDPITGEGLALAFRQAAALVTAIGAGDLARYASAHRRLAATYTLLTGLLLALQRRPPLRRAAFRVLAGWPSVFARLLAMNDGAPLRAVASSRFVGASSV